MTITLHCPAPSPSIPSYFFSTLLFVDEADHSSFSIAAHPILNKENNNINNNKQGRQILKQYLQEIGYTDTIIDVRSARLRTLLGLKSQSQVFQFKFFDEKQTEKEASKVKN